MYVYIRGICLHGRKHISQYNLEARRALRWDEGIELGDNVD